MLKEFKEFAVKGNALDLAVGVVIGAAFGAMVNSIVNDLFNPILGLFTGALDFRNFTIGLPGKEVLRIGSFINALINFLIVSFAVFLIVKQINRFRRQEVSREQTCQYCKTNIPLGATRCPACTSQLT